MVFILLKVRRGKSSAYFVHQNFIGSMRPAKILGFKISRKPDRFTLVTCWMDSGYGCRGVVWCYLRIVSIIRKGRNIFAHTPPAHSKTLYASSTTPPLCTHFSLPPLTIISHNFPAPPDYLPTACRQFRLNRLAD